MISMLEPTDPELGAALIEAARGPDFGAAILVQAQGRDSVREVGAYLVPDGGRPQTIAASGGLCNSDECAQAYVQGFYRYDPFLSMLGRTARHSGFAHRVPASHIRQRAYRSLCFERANLVDKLCFGWRSGERTLLMTFYRDATSGGPELDRLAGLAQLGLAALASRLRSEGRARTTPVVERLEARIGERYGDLTIRERQVAARTLAGWSTDSIAEALNIGAASVLTYRQRAYQRYSLSRAGEFLERLID